MVEISGVFENASLHDAINIIIMSVGKIVGGQRGGQAGALEAAHLG